MLRTQWSFIGQVGDRDNTNVERMMIILLVALCAAAVVTPLLWRDWLNWRCRQLGQDSAIRCSNARRRRARVAAETLVRILSTIVIGCGVAIWAARCWIERSLRHAAAPEVDPEHLLLWVAVVLALLRFIGYLRSNVVHQKQ